MRRRLEAIVHGSVHGVGFRMFAQREARALGLAGFVRNEPDGTVRIVAEGEEPALKDLLRRLERGPSEAEVSRVDARWGEATGLAAGFEIAF
jgi:acylphosphatase